jgi:hypothetical protein
MRTATLTKLLWLALFAGALAFGVSCGPPAACEEIGEACHPVDDGAGPAHDCHENSELNWSAAECRSNHDSCIALCEALPVDGGTGTDAAAASDAGDGG